MNEDQMREIASEGGKEGGREAAQEVLKALGVDIENTIEAQKDMHFLRDLRKGTSSVKGKVINTVVGRWRWLASTSFCRELDGGLEFSKRHCSLT